MCRLSVSDQLKNDSKWAGFGDEFRNEKGLFGATSTEPMTSCLQRTEIFSNAALPALPFQSLIAFETPDSPD